MVQGVGGLGGSQNTGSIKDLTEYQVYYPMYKSYMSEHKSSTISFEAWLVMQGYMGYFTQKVEEHIETNSGNTIDEKNGNTISTERHVSYGNNAIFQSQDEDTYYEFDYSDGSYRKLEGKKEAAQALGLPNDNNVDTIQLGYQSAIITDYTFGNLDDGQDSTKYRVNGRYGNVGYTQQEFDVHYILNALLMDPSDPQYQIAKQCFDDLCAHMSQWLPASDQQALDEIAAQYGTNSAEYKNKLQEVILKNLDQANEWVEEHSHVANVSATTLTELEETNGVQNPDEVQDGSGENDSTNISFDKSKVLDGAGLLADYTANKTVEGGKYSLKGRSSDEARDLAIADANKKAEEILNKAIDSLKAQLGDQYNDEIQTYISKAKETTLKNAGSWRSTKFDGGMLRKNRHQTSYVQTQPLLDQFFNEFNTLCANKGKTSSEVQAEQQAKEQEKEREKGAYQTIYNMNMQSEAAEAGADKDIQVVNANSAADIKAKAESSILQPLKNKIRSKLSGQGISDTNLNTMLDNAATAALADCTDWATTSNNVVYTIDASKLIDKFQENIKAIVKHRGYEF